MKCNISNIYHLCEEKGWRDYDRFCHFHRSIMNCPSIDPCICDPNIEKDFNCLCINPNLVQGTRVYDVLLILSHRRGPKVCYKIELKLRAKELNLTTISGIQAKLANNLCERDHSCDVLKEIVVTGDEIKLDRKIISSARIKIVKLSDLRNLLGC